MAIGAFTDREEPPSPAQIEAVLGAALEVWQALVALLEGAYRGKPELRYYGRSYGWAVRYRSRGRALASLYPRAGACTVQIILPEEAGVFLDGRALGSASRAALAAANRYREGRWLFLSVGTRDDLADVERLLAAKREAVRGQRTRVRSKLDRRRT